MGIQWKSLVETSSLGLCGFVQGKTQSNFIIRSLCISRCFFLAGPLWWRYLRCRDGEAAKAHWLNESVLTEMQPKGSIFLQLGTGSNVRRNLGQP